MAEREPIESLSLKWRMEELVTGSRRNLLKAKKEPNLGTVAMFIGAALRHPTPPCNGRRKWSSTIFVDQYKVKFTDVRIYCSLRRTPRILPQHTKVKFTDVRIYCSLANDELVKEQWLATGHEGEPDEAYKAACLRDDARHYRDCYLSMLELLPEEVAHYVCGAADYRELLCADLAELDRVLGHSIEQYEGGKYPQYLTGLTRRYGGTTFDDVRQYLAKVCCFKLE